MVPLGRKPAGRQQAAASVPTARIGVALSLTGQGAPYGAAQRNGVTLAVEEINASGLLGGARLRPIFADDGSDKTRGAEVFDRFINQEHVVAILGPTFSNAAHMADPVAQQAGVPVLAISNTAGGITEMGELIFRVSLTESQVIPQAVRAARERLGIKRAALIYGRDDVSTVATNAAFKKACQDLGIKVASEQSYARGDRDLGPQLAAIKAARPNALLVAALGDEASQVLMQARRAGLTDVSVVGGNGFNSPTVLRDAGAAAEGLVVGAAWNPASPHPLSEAFVKRYRARYNTEPDQFAAQAYAGTYVLAEGMRIARTTSDQRALRDGLAQVHDLDTVLGRFSFTPTRNAEHPAVVQIVRDGRLVPFVK